MTTMPKSELQTMIDTGLDKLRAKVMRRYAAEYPAGHIEARIAERAAANG